MKYRKLGQTSLELSVIGLGTWAIGGTGYRFAWGKQDDEDSVKAIYRALDEGINWIDTAAVYGLGHAEELIGKTLKDITNRPFIATKGGRLALSDGSLYGSLKRASIRHEVEDSLRRLKVDVIDLYQIHWPDESTPIEEAARAFDDLVRGGKVRLQVNLDAARRAGLAISSNLLRIAEVTRH